MKISIILLMIIVSSLLYSEQYFAGGQGTENSPWLINSAEQFNQIRDYLNSHFEQVSDINLDGYAEGQGWEPIGNSNNKFTGSFNGNDYRTANLYINRVEDDNLGLFGYVDNAVISNVILTNVSVKGRNNVGGIVGMNDNSSINNCSVFGSIQGNNNIGGLVGASLGAGAVVNKSFNNGTVSGVDRVGGLIGNNLSTSQISKCFSLAEVSGNDSIGGLLGRNSTNGLIEDSYSTGKVDGSHRVGGFIGWNSATLNRSYSTGEVNGSTSVGGLVGSHTGSISNCFWDIWTSGTHSSVVGVGKTTDELTSSETYSNWNLNDIWSIDESITYPYLMWQNNIYNQNIPLKQLSVSEDDKTFYTTFDNKVVKFVSNEAMTETIIQFRYTEQSTYDSVKEFLNTEALGAYYSFLFTDYTELKSGDYFELQLPYMPNTIWVKTNDNWKPLTENRVALLPENNDFTYRIYPLQESNYNRNNFSIEFASDKGGSQTLPVEMSSFTANVTAEQQISLNWKTETESNMLGYNIYRSNSDDIADASRRNFIIITAYNDHFGNNYSFTDENVFENRYYFYWLEALDLDLTSQYFGPISVYNEERQNESITIKPDIKTVLFGNYPNPFNNRCSIRFSLSEQASVTITIYDVAGRTVRSLITQKIFSRGSNHVLYWDGLNDFGKEVVSGTYILEMNTDSFYQAFHKLLLIK